MKKLGTYEEYGKLDPQDCCMKEKGICVRCGKLNPSRCCMKEEGTNVECEKKDPLGCCCYHDGICPNGLIKYGLTHGTLGWLWKKNNNIKGWEVSMGSSWLGGEGQYMDDEGT